MLRVSLWCHNFAPFARVRFALSARRSIRPFVAAGSLFSAISNRPGVYCRLVRDRKIVARYYYGCIAWISRDERSKTLRERFECRSRRASRRRPRDAPTRSNRKNSCIIRSEPKFHSGHRWQLIDFDSFRRWLGLRDHSSHKVRRYLKKN